MPLGELRDLGHQIGQPLPRIYTSWIWRNVNNWISKLIARSLLNSHTNLSHLLLITCSELTFLGPWFELLDRYPAIVSPRQTSIYEVCYLPRPPNRVRKLLSNLRTFKIQSRPLNERRGTNFKIFRREISLKMSIKNCIKIWRDGEVIWRSYWTDCAVEPRLMIMWYRSAMGFEKDNEISTFQGDFLELVLF